MSEAYDVLLPSEDEKCSGCCEWEAQIKEAHHESLCIQE